MGFQYDTAGRLRLVDLASGDLRYGYDAAGRLTSLSTPAMSLTYAYDGGLPTGTTWSGAVAGSVTRTYDNDFRVASLSVNGSNPVAVQYDADGLPIQVGDLSLTRDAQTGLITATALGAITDAVSYDGFGAPASYTASQAAARSTRRRTPATRWGASPARPRRSAAPPASSATPTTWPAGSARSARTAF